LLAELGAAHAHLPDAALGAALQAALAAQDAAAPSRAERGQLNATPTASPCR